MKLLWATENKITKDKHFVKIAHLDYWQSTQFKSLMYICSK